jgi:hypothetical protein
MGLLGNHYNPECDCKPRYRLGPNSGDMRKHFSIITCMDAGRHPRFFFRLPSDDKGSIYSVPKAVAEFLERNKERWPIADCKVV